MVAVTALILGFVTIGLVVVGVAFAGRRRPAHVPPSRESNALLYAGVAFVCVGIGLGLPLLLLIQNAKDADTQAVGGIDLTTAQAKGREMFANNCAACHTLRASNSVGKIGPDLDALRPPAGLTLNAIKVGRARGAGNMPALLLTGEDAKAVAGYIAAVAGRGEGVQSEPATPAQPTAGGGAPAAQGQANAAGKAVFAESCAGCHALKAAGASGQAGPDLDQVKPDEALVARRVSDGAGAMPPFKGQLSDEQIKAVAQYVAATAGQ